jgi:hypothetical protein
MFNFAYKLETEAGSTVCSLPYSMYTCRIKQAKLNGDEKQTDRLNKVRNSSRTESSQRKGKEIEALF